MRKNISENTRQQLQSSDAGERQLAAKKLRYFKSAEARDLIVAQLKVETESEVLEWLCRGAKASLALDAEDTLCDLTTHPVGDVRCAACEALGRVGHRTDILSEVALQDADNHVRLAAIEALETYGKRHQDRGFIEILRDIADALIADRERASLRDIGQAAKLAAIEVEKALDPPQLTLFEEEYLAIEMTQGSKARTIKRLEKFLAMRGGWAEEIQYIVSLVRSIKRDGGLVTRRKNEGIENCELCSMPFFVQKSGRLYCQVAHIKPLNRFGLDRVENTLLLCPNCHAQLDMARDTKITHAENTIHIQLPDKTEATFQINAGQAPQKIA